MANLRLTHGPSARIGMLIRKSVGVVFEAFIGPHETTKFWFTGSSGRLEVGRPVQWNGEMYGISLSVTAKAVEPDKRIVIEWPGSKGAAATVEWTFTPEH